MTPSKLQINLNWTTNTQSPPMTPKRTSNELLMNSKWTPTIHNNLQLSLTQSQWTPIVPLNSKWIPNISPITSNDPKWTLNEPKMNCQLASNKPKLFPNNLQLPQIKSEWAPIELQMNPQQFSNNLQWPPMSSKEPQMNSQQNPTELP